MRIVPCKILKVCIKSLHYQHSAHNDFSLTSLSSQITAFCLWTRRATGLLSAFPTASVQGYSCPLDSIHNYQHVPILNSRKLLTLEWPVCALPIAVHDVRHNGESKLLVTHLSSPCPDRSSFYSSEGISFAEILILKGLQRKLYIVKPVYGYALHAICIVKWQWWP